MGALYFGGSKRQLKTLYDTFIEKFGPETKPREGNNIRLVCPSCNKNSLSCDIVKGLIYCFHCGYGKGMSFSGTPAGEPEVEVDAALHYKVAKRVLEVCSLTKEHKAYLQNRSIYNPEEFGIVSSPFRIEYLLKKDFTEDELVASGFFYRGAYGVAPGSALKPRKILIPFYEGDKLLSIKSRSFLEEDTPKYACPRGSKIKSKVWYRQLKNQDTAIVEGELCAICSYGLGVQALGIPGIAQITDLLIERINTILKDNTARKFILIDRDSDLFQSPIKLGYLEKLNKGISNSCICIFPEVAEKVDVDFLVSNYGEDSYLDLLEDSWYKKDQTLEFIVGTIEKSNRSSNPRKNS